jgi:hypothetical protein
LGAIVAYLGGAVGAAKQFVEAENPETGISPLQTKVILNSAFETSK